METAHPKGVARNPGYSLVKRQVCFCAGNWGYRGWGEEFDPLRAGIPGQLPEDLASGSGSILRAAVWDVKPGVFSEWRGQALGWAGPVLEVGLRPLFCWGQPSCTLIITSWGFEVLLFFLLEQECFRSRCCWLSN